LFDLSTTLAVVGVLVGAVAAYYQVRAYLDSRKGSADKSKGDISSQSQVGQDLTPALLNYFWSYPLRGESESSWAVKESAVFRGNLQYAREKPGLGSAIVSTEFAIEMFGREAAASRIDGCVSWAISRVDPAPPHFLFAEVVDPVTYGITLRRDFRHTMALAIVLARSGRLVERLQEYLSTVLSLQKEDGGWPPGEGVTSSELFSVLYGLELSDICSRDERLEGTLRERCVRARESAAEWFLANASEHGMWASGVLQEFRWDDVVSTAWVLHRIVKVNVQMAGWRDCIVRATRNLVERAGNPHYWTGTPQLQQFRVETRVAAACALFVEADTFPKEVRERTTLYLNNWRRRAFPLACNLSDDDWDVSTALFYLQGYESHQELRRLSSQVIRATTLS